MILLFEVYSCFAVVACVLFAFYHFVAKPYLLTVLEYCILDLIAEFREASSKTKDLSAESIKLIEEELEKTQKWLGKITYGDVWQIEHEKDYAKHSSAFEMQKSFLSKSVPKNIYQYSERASFIAVAAMVVTSPLASPSLVWSLLPLLFMRPKTEANKRKVQMPRVKFSRHDALAMKVEEFEQTAEAAACGGWSI